MLTSMQWDEVVNHVRSKLDYYYDPALAFAENKELRDQLAFKHKGAYLGFEDSVGDKSFREGFLAEDALNVLESFDRLTDKMYSTMKSAGVPVTKVNTSTFYYTIISDVTYMPNPMQWNENRDGVYFMWGQDYRALYLPYQVSKMSLSKIEVMDRLCSWEAGVAANLWRYPEDLVYKLTCHSYKS